MITAPCLECKEREIGCHDRCDDYRKYRAEIDEANAKRREARAYSAYMAEQISNTKNSIRKKHYGRANGKRKDW